MIHPSARDVPLPYEPASEFLIRLQRIITLLGKFLRAFRILLQQNHMPAGCISKLAQTFFVLVEGKKCVGAKVITCFFC